MEWLDALGAALKTGAEREIVRAGRSWCQDADAERRAKLAPSRLWLKAPSRLALEGEYLKITGRVERGQVSQV